MKVILLGFNAQLLQNVTERVNEQRPVEVKFYTDLKDFLEACIEEQPELIGISVSYPHPKVSKFPKVFKMALNVPTLTFGENQDIKTRKALSASQGDLKIQGVLTAHNLWMKIVNFQKMLEEELEGDKGGPKGCDGQLAGGAVFLKSKNPPDFSNKSNILSNLFSALDDDGRSNRESGFAHIKSGDSGIAKQNHVYSESEAVDSGGKMSSMSHVTGTAGQSTSTSNRTAKEVNAKASALADLLAGDAEPSGGSQGSGFNEVAESQSPAENSKKDRGQLFEQLSEENGPGNESPSTDKGTFGKVQLKDEKEVKKEAVRKQKETKQRDQTKQKNVLEISSETALEKAFKAPRAETISRFSANKIVVFTVELGSIKGYLVVANQGNYSNLEQSLEFKKFLIEALKEQGAFGEISEPYPLNIDVENYVASISEFSEFNINHQVPEGEFFNVAFIQREVILPTLRESDKEDMYFVDIKVIPPQTPVNFDAFLYLPRNKRFVRYLKEGRSLSLKQAKRHTEEEDGQSQLYLPKSQKKQFEAFFIRNTLTWEFELHKKKDVA